MMLLLTATVTLPDGLFPSEVMSGIITCGLSIWLYVFLTSARWLGASITDIGVTRTFCFAVISMIDIAVYGKCRRDIIWCRTESLPPTSNDVVRIAFFISSDCL